MKIIKGVIIGATLMLSGCYSAPNVSQLAAADYGALPADYKEIVHGYYDSMLKDPDSAMIKDISSPTQGYLGNRITGVHYGYLVCATVNAKNSFGGYTGYKTDGFIIRNGEIVEAVSDINAMRPGTC